MVRTSSCPAPLGAPNEADIDRALAGDDGARERVKWQKTRVKKRLREIDAYVAREEALR